MGCVNSKPDINDQHPNIFEVTNVGEERKPNKSGQLEITESEIKFHQRGVDQPTTWPLKSLRKYGFEAEIFSFECGRRCATGQGVYGFHCRKAEQIFNILQHHIARNSTDETANQAAFGTGEFPVPVVSTGPPVPRRIPSQPEGYLNPIATPNNPTTVVRPHPTLSRPGSVTSNGPTSPTAVSPPPFLVNKISSTTEHNNNKRGSLIPDHQYSNSGVLAEIQTDLLREYANMGAVAALASPTTPGPIETIESPSRLYMNVDVNNPSPANTKELEAEEDLRHCYANIDTKELELLRSSVAAEAALLPPPTPTTPPPYSAALYVAVHEVNYAELDLEPVKSEVAAPVAGEPVAGGSLTNNDAEKYATIDFQKTNALSQSINPPQEVEEGSRKTRHNSTISEVNATTTTAARHSNSLSD